MKMSGMISGLRMKAVPVKNEQGRQVGANTYWVISLTFPAHQLSTDALSEIAQEVLQVELNPLQTQLPIGEPAKSEKKK